MIKAIDVSLLVPTYRGPDLLKRCLGSILIAIPQNQERFEAVVGDDSVDGGINVSVLADFSSRWRGLYTYVLHSPHLDQQRNFNELLRHAKGRLVQFLHDDDYFLEGAGHAFLDAANRPDATESPVKSGVWLVTQEGWYTRTESPSRERRLSPRECVRLMISKSSYVRFPAMVAEAISLGLPIITMDLHSMRDIITDNCGFLANAENPHHLLIDIASAISAPDEDRAPLTQLSEGTLIRAEQLGASHQMPLLFQFYDTIIGGTSR